MATAITRQQFLRGDFSGKETPLRPPWARTENIFLQLCNRCGDCIESCPTHIIRTDRGARPVVDFEAGECLFCNECARSCKTGALTVRKNARPWTLSAAINSKTCLAWRNIECRSCVDPCIAQAINITPRLGGVSIPLLNNSRCTGCGACISVCPVTAIKMQPHRLQATS